MAENKEIKASTEAKRQKKAERRDAKAARKEANKAEDKKSRPNNIILALMIFGVLIIMFAFAGGYNYFSKPANIEKYVKDNGVDQMYNDAPISEHTTMKLKADKNTLKIWLNVDADAPAEELEQFQGEEGTDNLKNMGAYFLTSMKPQTRALSADVKIKVKQGDESINYVKMSYKEAKKFLKDLEKKAEEEYEDAADADADADAGADAEAGTDAEAGADAAATETEGE
jgi:hypothetical protein